MESSRDPQPAGPHERVHVVVRGRVQGVGFRDHVCRRARSLGAAGWVRNLAGGDVELEAQGPRDVLEQLLAAVRRGPPGSRVDGADVRWIPAEGTGHDGFDITY